MPERASSLRTQIHHNVTPDSLLLLRAAREVVEEDGFDDILDSVRDRIDEIESLHRTRELTVRLSYSLCYSVIVAVCSCQFDTQFKDVKAGDRIRLTVDKGGALLVDS